MSSPALQSAPGRPTKPAQPEFMSTLYGLQYDTYGANRTHFLFGFAFETLMVAAVVLAGTFAFTHRDEIKAVVSNAVVEISPYVLAPSEKAAGGGGGGGDRDKLAAPKGALPKLSAEQITPPAVVIRNSNPKLAVAPTVVVPPQIKLPQSGQMGDPLSAVLGPPSNGIGSGGGIGSGSGGGVGSGRGPGVGPGWGGGIGGGAYRVGGGVSAPRALYAPDPEYSEEARKAKYSGTVVLYIEVDTNGQARNVRVVKGIGLGLDEKAIEAVTKWKFRPGMKDGRPVIVKAQIEVNFRLL